MQDGQSFRDVRDLKRLLLRDQRQLARNILSQLTTYATGTPIRFADRSTIEAILDESASTGFRVRDLLVLFVKSNIFSGQKHTTSR
jgi:hypothetical protein